MAMQDRQVLLKLTKTKNYSHNYHPKTMSEIFERVELSETPVCGACCGEGLGRAEGVLNAAVDGARGKGVPTEFVDDRPSENAGTIPSLAGVAVSAC